MHAVKAYGGMEAGFPPIFYFGWSKLLASLPGRFVPGKEFQVPIQYEAGGSARAFLGAVEKG